MQAEKLFYPYIPGEYGIPFSDLIDEFKFKRKRFGFIHGGSGAEMEFKFNGGLISVRDIAHPDRGMLARLAYGVASFNIQTRKLPTDRWENEPDLHPDMFAAKFVSLALEYFQNEGEEVTACEGLWAKGSVNRETFLKELRIHGDHVMAARATWSGKLFSSLGFSRIERSDIEVAYSDENLKITAMFRRPFSVELCP